MSFEELRDAYNAARGWLSILIDNPDKTVSVAEYKAQIKSAQKSVVAAHKAMMAAWA